MRNIIVLLFTYSLASIMVNAQSSQNSSVKTSEYASIPKEKVFIHYNTAVVFPGEYIYYSFYCLEEKKRTSSQLSKVGYVALVNEEKQVIMRQKLNLTNGLGQGDYFVPTNIPSGNYKIIGYTQWMRNTGVESFFKADITVLNPYQGNQDKLILKTDTLDANIVEKQKASLQLDTALKLENGFKMTVDQEKYGKRKKVPLKLETTLGKQGYGNFSISVRHISSSLEQKRTDTKDFSRASNSKKSSEGEVLFLPELRGSLLPVKVVSETGDAVKNANVSMSIPGENYVFKIASSNADGTVFFNLNDTYEGNLAIFQILGDNDKNYKIVPDNQPEIDYSNLNFNQFKITEKLASAILERSIYNQIENAFTATKQDTISAKEFNPVFNYNEAVRYSLDDYTRFKTVKETLVEIVKDVWTKKNSNKQDVFQVRWTGSDLESVVLPLVLLDGMVVQDHQFLVDYDARKIARIHVLKGTYILGRIVYDGILVFESIKALQPDEINLGETLQAELLSPEQHKIYFNPHYDDENEMKLQHIPDYRQQLFWKPNLRLTDNAQDFEFYTSDVSGSFLVEIQGFTNSGRPISLSKIIQVE